MVVRGTVSITIAAIAWLFGGVLAPQWFWLMQAGTVAWILLGFRRRRWVGETISSPPDTGKCRCGKPLPDGLSTDRCPTCQFWDANDRALRDRPLEPPTR